MRAYVLAFVVLFLAIPVAQDRPLPDFDTFAAQVKKRLATDEERQSGYMFTERRTEQKLDGSGRMTNESVQVFEVYPGLPGEDRYRRLVEENGKRIPETKLTEQDAERRKTVESYSRRISNTGEQQKEARERDQERKRYADAIDDLFRVYDIKMVGRESLGGHETILATLTPKSRPLPRTDDGKIMQHFKVRAWISESDYELVRAEIEAVDDLSFGLGLLARVHKGTVATYQRKKVNNETWLPEQVTWTASARVLLLRRLRLRGTSEFSNYHKFTVDTSTTYSNLPR